MADSAHRRAILRRRMAFVSSTLAAITGCDKGTPVQVPTADVEIGDPDPTTTLPTAVAPNPAPSSEAQLPPAPSTEIPETSCQGDRAELERLRSAFDAIYAETNALYAALPSGCAVTDDACAPKYQPLAKRYAELTQRNQDLVGLCSCPAPIVEEYLGKHRPETARRMTMIRERIVESAPDPDAAGDKWQQYVRNEATPRPCLSCVMCTPKSACDP